MVLPTKEFGDAGDVVQNQEASRPEPQVLAKPEINFYYYCISEMNRK